MNEYLEPIRYNEGKVDWTLLPWDESTITKLVTELNKYYSNEGTMHNAHLFDSLMNNNIEAVLAVSLLINTEYLNPFYPPTRLPWDALEDVCRVFAYGCVKYQRDNYKLVPGLPLEGYIQSMWRHLVHYLRGEEVDIESKLPHLSHLACNCFMYLWTQKEYHTK